MALGGAGLGALHGRYGLDNLKTALKEREVGILKRLTDPKMRNLASDVNKFQKDKLNLVGDVLDKAKIPLALGGAGMIAKKKLEEDNDNDE